MTSKKNIKFDIQFSLRFVTLDILSKNMNFENKSLEIAENNFEKNRKTSFFENILKNKIEENLFSWKFFRKKFFLKKLKKKIGIFFEGNFFNGR